jgi:hypothetical protein
MGHPDEVKNHRVRGHSNPALPIRPSQKLISVMLEDRGFKDAFLAITDWASHHAVMASNTGREPVHEGAKIFGHPLEFSKEGIPLLRSLGNDLG